MERVAGPRAGLSVLAVAVLMAAASPGVAEARIPLKDDRVLENGLTLVAIGNYLRRGCDEITPKFFKTYSFMQALQKRARDLGYSDAEIEAYLDSEPDKERVKASARAYLEARGADFDDPGTLCAVGRAEIASDTSVGRFLTLR